MHVSLVASLNVLLAQAGGVVALHTISLIVELLNANPEIYVILDGMVTEVRPLQPSKAWNSMLVTPSGKAMEVKLEQPLKADSPILVTLPGMVMEVKLEQPLKADSPMLVTPSGMVTEVKSEHL